MIKFIKTYKENLILMLDHFATDIVQGSVSATLAIMYSNKILTTNFDVSLLVLASTLVSSIVQPIVGWLSDKNPRPYLLGLGMIIAALGLMSTGFVTNFTILFILITISGIGVAIFHPQAGKMANYVSKERKGLGMSIFSVGGNLGFAAGPAVVSFSTYLFGLPGVIAIGIPAIVMLIIFSLRYKKYVFYSYREKIKQKSSNSTEEESVFGFCLLTIMIFFRSCVLFGLTTFTPLYFMGIFGLSAEHANLNLTVIAVCAAIASMVGGYLADKIGFKNVLAYSATTAIPFMFAFCFVDNSIIATLLLIPVALSIYGTLSVSMVLGQKFLCRHVGFASGVTIGLGITFGGMFAPILGMIGDSYGLRYTMLTLAILTIFSSLFAWIVPDIDKIRKQNLNKNSVLK